MSFFKNKTLISGYLDVRVNISDLENLDKKKGTLSNNLIWLSKCIFCKDRKIPVGKVDTCSEFRIAMVDDIDGNCKF